ncbi:MAG: hypothetical protein AAFR55_00690 [Pseudomonadota bacterium]
MSDEEKQGGAAGRAAGSEVRAGQKADKAAERRERLAQALRENLKKRKAQARLRGSHDTGASDS